MQDLPGSLRSVASAQAAAYLRLEGRCDDVTHIACAFSDENLIPMRDARVQPQQPPTDCRTVARCASFLAYVAMHDPDATAECPSLVKCTALSKRHFPGGLTSYCFLWIREA